MVNVSSNISVLPSRPIIRLTNRRGGTGQTSGPVRNLEYHSTTRAGLQGDFCKSQRKFCNKGICGGVWRLFYMNQPITTGVT